MSTLSASYTLTNFNLLSDLGLPVLPVYSSIFHAIPRSVHCLYGLDLIMRQCFLPIAIVPCPQDCRPIPVLPLVVPSQP
jgi:hypothetical protein